MAKGKQKPIDIERLKELDKELRPVSREEFNERLKKNVTTKKPKKQ